MSKHATMAIDPDALASYLKPETQDDLVDSIEPETPGIREPEVEGIREPETPGIREPEVEGIREPETPGIREPEVEGIREPEEG
ncbi:MAG: hypothetical protein ACI81L_002345 [Verrucomicrobiales bacterium]|jgi:hypothetical protein